PSTRLSHPSSRFRATPTPVTYPLSLHDALPISVLVPGDLRRRPDDHRPFRQLDPAQGVVVGHDPGEAFTVRGVDAHGGQLLRQQPEAQGQLRAAVPGEVPVVRLEERAAARVRILPLAPLLPLLLRPL